MLKAEPLKNKIFQPRSMGKSGSDNSWFFRKDVACAVEWLKKEINNQSLIEYHTKEEYIELIKEAFADVVEAKE